MLPFTASVLTRAAALLFALVSVPTSAELSDADLDKLQTMLSASNKMPEWFIFTLIAALALAIIIILTSVFRSISNDGWKLREALSEEAEFDEEMPKDAASHQSENAQTATHTVKVTRLVGSSSRLIAFLGMIVILILFVGYGLVALYHFAMGGLNGEEMTSIGKYLVAGLTLFAPYTVNKFASIFGK